MNKELKQKGHFYQKRVETDKCNFVYFVGDVGAWTSHINFDFMDHPEVEILIEHYGETDFFLFKVNNK